MVYCTSADVIKFMPEFTVGATDHPTSAQLTLIIVDVSAEIDAALLSRAIAVPVTTPPSFLADLLRLCAIGSAAYALAGMFPQAEGVGHSGLGVALMAEYLARVEEIRHGIGIPIGVVYSESDMAPRAFLTDAGAWGQPDGTVTDLVGNLIQSEPKFRVGMVL